MGVSPLSVTTGQLTAGALIMLPVSMFVDQPWTHAFPPITAWGAIVALALLCTAFGYVLYFRLIETSGRDQCPARDPARPAGRDPARRRCSWARISRRRTSSDSA